MSAQNRDAVRRLVREVMSNGNLAAGEEVLSPNLVDHMPILETPDRDGLLKAMMAARRAFSGVRYKVIAEISNEHWVAMAVEADGGVHKGPFMGIAPTGKPVKWTETHLWKVIDAKIVEHYGNVSMFEIHKALGSHNIESKLR